MSVGQSIGMTSLPFLSNRFGRKAAMYWYWLILAMGVLCEALHEPGRSGWSPSFLPKIGVSCLQSTIPTYIAEVAPRSVFAAVFS